MQRERPKRTRVLFAMDWMDYELTLGIAQYAREAGWIVNDLLVRTGVAPANWQWDGAISLLNHPDGKINPFVKGLECPVVDLANEVPELKVPRVLVDDYGIGRTAAEHLLSCGLHHFAFFKFWDTEAERERRRGFQETIEKAGRAFYLLDAFPINLTTDDFDETVQWLSEHLLRLPRPLGVMSQHDRESMMVVSGCELANLAVPEEVAVVGSNNDPLLCELGHVPLSSVDVRRRDQGYQAAKLLDSIIKGKKPPGAPILVPSGPVVVRQSSEVLAVPDPHLSMALQYIAAHYREQIRVEDVFENAGTTRRRLYKLFEQHLGRPIHSEILRRRLDHARRLLVTTPDKLYSVARASGFLDAQNLTRVFIRELGVSPSRYRQQQAGTVTSPALEAIAKRA